MREMYTTELELSDALKERLQEALEPELLQSWGVDADAPSPKITTLEDSEEWVAAFACDGEIEIRSTWLEHPREKLAKVEMIQAMYLHEYAHILTPGHGHDCIFYAVMLTFYRRAFGEKWTHYADCLYDVQNEATADDFARRIAFAVNFSKEYAATPFSGPILSYFAMMTCDVGGDDPFFFERNKLERHFMSRARMLVQDMSEDVEREARAAQYWESQTNKAKEDVARSDGQLAKWKAISSVLVALFLGSFFLHL